MTVLDRLLLAATVTGLAAVVWRVEQLRGEVTDKRIDSAALALHGWGRDERAGLAHAGGFDLTSIVEAAFAKANREAGEA